MNAGYNRPLNSEIGPEELKQFEDLAKSFCRRTLLEYLDNEEADGDFSILDSIVLTAFNIGIAALPDPEAAGYEYGIWGSIAHQDMAPSVMFLMKIAQTCGGIASLFHFQGLASNIFIEFKERSQTPEQKIALCLLEDFGLPSLKTLHEPETDSPAKIKTTIKKSGKGYLLNGLKTFVYSMKDTAYLIVFARYNDTWACVNLPAGSGEIIETDPGIRTGLRACTLNHIEFSNVVVPEQDIIFGDDALSLLKRALCLNWAGLAAIACGIAKGSVKSARQYASERYQGGTIIENHAAVQMLIAESEANAAACRSLAESLSGTDPMTLSGLRFAAAAKLKCCELGAKAVTDSLQVFGGYGYMEDYGMEKRLRDISVLKAGWGTPNFLKKFIFECGREV